MKSIIVEKCRKNEMLVPYILEYFPSLNKNILFKALRNKDIKLNNKRVSSNLIVKKNDILDIYIDDIYLYNLPKSIDYIYTDDNILIAYKPQGLLSNNEGKKIDEPTFEDLVKKEYSNAKICHRLDRNTAGLLIFSLNDLSYTSIISAFKNKEIKKEYIAYVHDCNFEKDSKKLEGYIVTDKNTGLSKIYSNKTSNSSKIITSYNVLHKNKKYNYAILNIQIETGKTHQIRAQFKVINHPIIGDSKYGNNDVNKKFGIYKQLLFAYKYTFSFNKDSFLYYLNGKNIELNEKVYLKNIGGFNGKRKKER